MVPPDREKEQKSGKIVKTKGEGYSERDLEKIRRDSKTACILEAQAQVAQELTEWSPQSPASLAAQQERDKKLANARERANTGQGQACLVMAWIETLAMNRNETKTNFIT